MKPRFIVGCAVLCFCITALAISQDAAKADPAHYKIETDNARVRVLRVHYGPGEKSAMHSHPDSVAIFLTDGKAKMTYPDGKSEEMFVKAGQTQYTPAGSHLPENVGNNAFELIVVELKDGGGHSTMK